MTELVEFLRARYDERERKARAVPEAPWAARSDPTSNPDVISVPRDRDHGRNEVVLSDVWRDGMVEYAVDNDPAHVLADLDAKRRILDYHAEQLAGAAYNQREGDWEHEGQYGLRLEAVEHVLKLLALPHAGHPDYRSEWAVAK